MNEIIAFRILHKQKGSFTNMSSVLVLGTIGDIINNVGAWTQTNVGITLTRTLGVMATIYGVWMIFRAATSRQGQSGGRWLQAAVALIVGFGMIMAPSFYSKLGSNTNDSVQQAVGTQGTATVTAGQTINLAGQAQQAGHTVVLK